MRKLSESMWADAHRKNIGIEVRKENDPRIKISEFMEKKGITKYTINDDFTIDVDGNVILSQEDCPEGKIPFKFGKVSGDFECRDNKLTSLEGSPKEVDGGFYCSHNQITSLEGCPKKVSGGFYCTYNQLTSLEGCPKKVDGDFFCSNNKLTSLEGGPEKVIGDFYCFNNLTKFTIDDVKNICNVGGRISV